MINTLFALIMPIVFLLPIALAKAVKFNIEIEETLSISMLESVFILYITGFFDLRIGLLILFFIDAICLVYIVRTSYQCGIKAVIDRLFSLYTLIILLLYLFVFVLNYGKEFSHWDEVSHWGIMAKDLYYNHHYYFFEDAKLIVHNEYPPLMPLLGYLWCGFSLGYSEAYLYSGKLIFGLSLLIPMVKWDRRSNKRPYLDIIIVLLIPLCVIVGEASFFRTIYADSLMAIVTMASVYDVIRDDESVLGKIKTTLLLSALVISKEIAIFYFIVIVTMWLICDKSKLYNLKKIEEYGLTKFIVPIMVWGVWKLTTRVYCSNGQFYISSDKIRVILSVVTGRDETYRTGVVKSFLNSLMNPNLSFGRFSVSYLGVILLALIATGIYTVIAKKIYSRSTICLWIVLLASILYSFVMLLAYLYGYSEREATNLACYDRYMSTMVFIQFGILFTCFQGYFVEYNRIPDWVIKGIAVAGCLLIIPVETYFDEIMPGRFYHSTSEIYEGDAAFVNEHTEKESSIFVIYQGANASARDWMAYLTYPRIISEVDYSVGTPSSADDIFTNRISLDDLLSEISEFDYLYLGKVDARFINEYSSMFDNIEDIKNQALYKVDNTDVRVGLNYISSK